MFLLASSAPAGGYLYALVTDAAPEIVIQQNMRQSMLRLRRIHETIAAFGFASPQPDLKGRLRNSPEQRRHAGCFVAGDFLYAVYVGLGMRF